MLIEGGMTADFDELQSHIASMARVLRKHRNITISSQEGESLEFSIAGRWNLEDNGICNRPGQVTNLPAGKIFAEVKSESVTGVIKVNGTWDSASLSQPISIVVDEGKMLKQAMLVGQGMGMGKGAITRTSWRFTVDS